MNKLLLFGLFLPLFALAQERAGVHFEEGSNWPAILEKAKAENKYIFVDCYTTWCGPCKLMKDVVFPQVEAGDYFNKQFVCVGVQLDSTRHDNDTVKSWYAKAHELEVTYHIKTLPTFLIFSPDGKALTRLTSANEKASDFIARVKEAMSPDKQYYALLDRYEHGEKDTALLRKIAIVAMEADSTISEKASDDYLSRQENQLSKYNLEFIELTTQSSKGLGFQVLLHHMAQVDALLGTGNAEQKVMSIILKEEARSFFNTTSGPDWEMATKIFQTKYPQLADELLLKAKAEWGHFGGNWTNYLSIMTKYMKKYGQDASPADCSQFAWDIFLGSSDKSCLRMALGWIKKSLENNPTASNMYTYANILYRLGHKEEAIAAGQKSLALASEDQEKAIFRQTLEKMQKGEKTWE